MSKLSMMDLAFYISETDASPRHVSGLMIFKKPKAKAGIAKKVYDYYRQADEVVGAPLNQTIHFSLSGSVKWVDDPNFCLRDHLFFHKLKKGSDDVAMREFCAELHSEKLSRDKPLWEMHIIDGLSNGRFAVFSKIHHAYADGMTLARWTADSLSDDPNDERIIPVWEIAAEPRKHRARIEKQLLSKMLDTGRSQFNMLRGMNKLFLQVFAEQFGVTKNAVAVPFRSQKTMLTGQVEAGRQIGTAKLPMDRVLAVGKKTRSTLNHIALTCIDGALHEYMAESGRDLDEAITINMPVNLRREGEGTGGNRIGIVLVNLAERTEDPYKRLREIGFTLRNVRYQVDGVEPEAMVAYTLLFNGVSTAIDLLGMSNSLPPLGNTLVSNVPGPKQTKYLAGAELLEMYPISTLAAGHHLNITLFSYGGNLCVGLIASQLIPEIERLAELIQTSFEELEAVV